MHKTIRTYIKPDSSIADLIFENPYLLLLLEHFGLDSAMHGKNVAQICSDNGIDEKVFIAFANLYNGFPLSGSEVFDIGQTETIIRFLSNSHHYFRNDKYPELQGYIRKIYEKNPSDEIMMTGKFFDEYFMEVTEHLDYEENVAFPYFRNLLKKGTTAYKETDTQFSATGFLDHHTDIESKLTDLKNLLIRHVSLKNDPVNRRKLLFSLIELEFVLYIHSLIEESILVPMVIELEKKQQLG